ncbi:MAG: calcium-binding protein [Ramlibacter sp.]|jgi:Ca2+-binding RTX toxin-like protein|nr:calcium-binding protein [Ramlibacter sp.]
MQEGTEGNDTIIGLNDFADSIEGGGGDDWIEGGDSTNPYDTDSLSGGAGNDTLLGGSGNDHLEGGSGDDRLDGGSGNDILAVRWGVGHDTLSGGVGNDAFWLSLVGSSDEQTVRVYGGGGDDSILLDVIFHDGGGLVAATGGAGQDTYYFTVVAECSPASGLFITDFQPGAGGDRIDLAAMLDFSGTDGRGYEGGNAFHAGQGYLRLVQRGADTLLQYDEDGSAGHASSWHTAVALRGVELSSLTAENLDGLPPDGSALPGQVLAGHRFPVVGTFFDDTITGSGDSDEIFGSGGNDWIDGGDESDAHSGDRIHAGPGTDTVIGGLGGDYLEGGPGDDLLLGGAGADGLSSRLGQGNDTFMGGAEDDWLSIQVGDASGPQVVIAHGGSGDDEFNVYFGGDRGADDVVLATGGGGQDTYIPGGSDIRLMVTDFAAAAGGDRMDVARLLPSVPMQGGYQGDLMRMGYVRLVQRGDHTLLQYDIDGKTGSTHDWRTAITLRDVDVETIDEHNFVAVDKWGANGADTVLGGLGADTLAGYAGNDLLDGGSGGDLMDGGMGNDRYVVDALSDQVIESGGNGADTVVAHVDYVLAREVENLVLGSGAFIGRGNGLDNTMRGNELDIQLHGRAGDDSLAGGDGADTLSGGAGADQLQGGAGPDVFRFTAIADSGVPLDARDVIVDFTRGGSTADGDKVDLSRIDAIAGNAGNDAFTFIGDAKFSTTDASGQLRFAYHADRGCVVLYGSVDADGDAEFAIELSGVRALGAADLIL